MRVHRIAAVLTTVGILTLGGVATIASADGWNTGTGPRAVSFHDLERPECADLRMGASGWCTVALQTTLSQVGCEVAVDGKFGPVTKATVLLFQRDNHARMQDGIVGPETRYLLGAAMDLAVSHNNVGKHNDGRWPSIICSPFKIFGMTCEDLVGGSPAYWPVSARRRVALPSGPAHKDAAPRQGSWGGSMRGGPAGPSIGGSGTEEDGCAADAVPGVAGRAGERTSAVLSASP